MKWRKSLPLLAIVLLSLSGCVLTRAATPIIIRVDAKADCHPINPLIYGVAFAHKADLAALNAPLDRQGGNNFSTYNWANNTLNIDSDWYFESIPGFFLNEPTTLEPGQRADGFIADAKAAGAQPAITIPMLGWVARVGDPAKVLSSFSVAKYGPQQKTAPGEPDAGNGMKPDGTPIAGNDPNDAYVPSSPEIQRRWVEHLLGRWGTAERGGVQYYIMDNEPGLWNSTHRDIHPDGFTRAEYLQDLTGYGGMIKSADPGARIIAPESWGWPDYFYSGSDALYRSQHHYQGHPDQDANGGLPFIPWLLTQARLYQQKTGKRLLDVLSVHIYPEGGDDNDKASPQLELLRNRDTRALWDPNYVDEDWVNDKIRLIPRLKAWVNQYYPGTKIAITEYSWGAEKSMNGATAQADLLGIFGREGLDMAAHWQLEDGAVPLQRAFQMYRNYDGRDRSFGDISVLDTVPDPDTLSSFAALRSSDHALTVMAINKSLDQAASIALDLSNFQAGDKAQVWQLTSSNPIDRLPDATVATGRLTASLPAQSITLFVVPDRGASVTKRLSQ